MANYPSVVYQGFTADIGVHGKNRRGKVVAPAHLKLSFSSRVYFHVSKNTPYVGTIHLEQPYELPPVGVVQLVVFNPMKTPLKTFLVNASPRVASRTLRLPFIVHYVGCLTPH